MAGWRLLRCNPWSDGGVDYVDYEFDSADARRAMVSGTVSKKMKEGVL